MKRLPAFLLPAFILACVIASATAADSIPATGADGRMLNLGFEDGTLRDWTATGEAFAKQPVKGEIDQARPFGKGRSSKRQGDFWIGGYEIVQDKPKGALTSVAFKITQPWGSFLIGGGSLPGMRVEIVTKDDGQVIHTARGSNREEMARSVVDLRKFRGREIFVRIVDEESPGWGHVNFDDFIFHAQEPKFPAEQLAQKPGAKDDPNLKPDTIEFAGLPAEKAAQVATVPAGYELKVFAAEPDIINPIAFCMDDRARVWVVEGMTYPQRAKTEPGAPEWLGGADRILVFEDTDGDGKSDKRTVFMEGLNLVSGIEVGFGGVFVGAAPNLIFIPVENWDEPKPGKVEVLLDGWGYQDTHETLNTFHWGPDGWLYGCHGVFTHSNVGKPGTPNVDANEVEKQRAKLAATEKKLQKAKARVPEIEKALAELKEASDRAQQSIALGKRELEAVKAEKSRLELESEKESSAETNEMIARLGAKINNLRKVITESEENVREGDLAAVDLKKVPGLVAEIENDFNQLAAEVHAGEAAAKLNSGRTPLNAGIWRWHPQRKEFEVFAHGTSNPWGMDWNADGDLFAEACVIPHLFHIIQGGRYHRQAGQHFDPHTYDDIKTIADHRHYLGEKPHAGNARSDAAGGGHAHAGLCIPQHPSWPDGIRGNVLMGNIHGARINMDVLERKGSGYVAHHGADFINFHDKASQIVDLREGPDGTLFMIDWYDVNQCHRPQREVHDYTTGRIFRLGRKGQIVKAPNLNTLTLDQLAAYIKTDESFMWRTALRLIRERLSGLDAWAAEKVWQHFSTVTIAGEKPSKFWQHAMRFGDALHKDADPAGYAWTLIQDGDKLMPTTCLAKFILEAAQAKSVDSKLPGELVKIAKTHKSPIVRLALASACQRLTVEQRKPIVLALLAHEEDKDDHNLPFMYWYAAEPIVAADPAWAAEALGACKIPKVSEFIARRLAEQ